MIPAITLAGTAVALWAAATGRTRIVFAGALTACAAGSYGYITASPLPLSVTLPMAVLGCIGVVVFLSALIVACQREERP